jgi:hypothetical protein
MKRRFDIFLNSEMIVGAKRQTMIGIWWARDFFRKCGNKAGNPFFGI